MINAHIFKNKENKICGFEIKNHGKDIVCSAVSILSLNTCNSIEKFTKSKFLVDFDEKGGYLSFNLKDKDSPDNDTTLILNCLELGLIGIELEYQNEIKITYEEV